MTVEIVTLGEMLIDMFPAEIGRRLVDVSAFRPKPGGAPANVAVAARRLGASAAFIGKVGDDAFGQLLIDTLASEGVETQAMRVDPEARTTMAFIAMPDEHHAEFVFYRNPGADMMLRPDELDEALLRTTRAFHFGSISLISEPSRSATLRAIEIARDAGALVSFDVNYRPSLWPQPETAATTIREALPLAHLVKVNDDELGLLTEERDAATGSPLLLALGPQACVVTHGARGTYYRTRDSDGFVPAYPVETVDAVGCGDAFMAGLLVRLVTGEVPWTEQLANSRMADCVRYANGVGALTATRQGVIPALPHAAQVEAFLAAQATAS